MMNEREIKKRYVHVNLLTDYRPYYLFLLYSSCLLRYVLFRLILFVYLTPGYYLINNAAYGWDNKDPNEIFIGMFLYNILALSRTKSTRFMETAWHILHFTAIVIP